MEHQTLQRIGLTPGAAEGRVVVVTGAGSGIGRAIAQAFAWLGCCVVIAEISGEGKEVERQIRDAGGKAVFVQTDVSDPAQVSGMAQRVKDTFGTVDILINNAMRCPVASVVDMEVDTWDSVMAVNLRGAFLTCKAFLPGMLAQNRGVIINMVSTEAMTHLSAYIASKQGLVGFSQSLAAEVGASDVRVIAFAPGIVDTPGLRGAAATLAPHLGITPEQLTNLSIHPGYPGSMPVEDAAAATAYLSCVLAAEYHGEATNGYTILERAGYLKPTTQTGTRKMPSLPSARQEFVSPHRVPVDKAIELSQRLLEVIAEHNAEIDKMPVFVRPMARGGFKSKAGQSLQDWRRDLEQFTGQLQRASAGDVSAQATLQKDIPHWLGLLDKLESYFQGVPAATAGFTRDKAFLSEVQRLADERVAAVRGLRDSLQNSR